MSRLARLNLTISAVAWVVAGILAAITTAMHEVWGRSLAEAFLGASAIFAFVVAIVALCRGFEMLEKGR